MRMRIAPAGSDFADSPFPGGKSRPKIADMALNAAQLRPPASATLPAPSMPDPHAGH